MKFGSMYVTQYGNRYIINNAYGYTMFIVETPLDGQLLYDAKIISNICSVLNARMKINERCEEGKPASGGYYGFRVLQVGDSSYAIFRPDNNVQIALANFPPNSLLDDHKALTLICRLLSLRYQLKV